MILNDPHGRPAAGVDGRAATLDDLFRRAAARRPEAIALIDPPNRASITGDQPRRLTYAQADRMISAIAGRLRRIGLQTDALVGLQFANCVDSVLTLLAVLRAGMIAMPMPLLWRRAEAAAALARVGINALIVGGRVGQQDYCELALQVATDVFSIRTVCGFGESVPDGLVPLSELYTAEELDPVPPFDLERSLPPGPGAHLAVVTWDVAADGPIPVGRNHAELVAGGAAVLLESRLKQDAVILNILAMSSFGGLAAVLVPWLLVGGTLALQHPSDVSAFVAQRGSMDVDVAILPGPLVAPFADAGHLPAHPGSRIIGVWRAPDRLPRAPTWRDDTNALTDVQVFGEIGLIAARRGADGSPRTIPFGVLSVPSGAKSAVIVGEIRPGANGTVAMRGPMVPRCPYPPGVERTLLPQLKIAQDGFVDTGYACWSGHDNASLIVTGPPPGTVSVGGYRFLMRDLQDTLGEVAPAATLAALPDALSGHRLAGSAPDAAGIRQALSERGVSPLLVNAFRDRRPAPEAPARGA